MSRIMRGAAVAGVVAMFAASAFGQIANIQSNWLDATQDTFFDGMTLTISESVVAPENRIAVHDTFPAPATYDEYASQSVSLTTTFDHVGFDTDTSEFYLVFKGGSFGFAFNDSADIAGADGPYDINGPIDTLVVTLLSSGPTSQLSAEGLFEATTTILPGSGSWIPQGSQYGSNLSSIDSLIIEIGQNFSTYDWQTHPEWTGVGNAQIQIIPDDTAIPEPATLSLLVLGGLALLRRRR